MRHSNEKSYVLSKGYDEIRFSDEINMFIYFAVFSIRTGDKEISK